MDHAAQQPLTTALTPASLHTPGPWEAWDDDGTGTLPCVLSKSPNSSGTYYVAEVKTFSDACLIAAAPELLEVLISIHGMLKHRAPSDMTLVEQRTLELVVPAIAKANGAA